MWIFRPSKLHRKKVRRNNVDFPTIEIKSKKDVEKKWIFRPAKLHQEKYVDTKRIFRPAKLHRKKYVETTSIFRPSKLRRKKYVETTWIFRSAKLHRKSTWKWRLNSSKFGLQGIDVISTSNRRGFDMVCPLVSYVSLVVHRYSLIFFIFDMASNSVFSFWTLRN